MESFKTGTVISLEDRKLNKTQDMMVNPTYNFTYTKGDDRARFLLHFYNPYFGIPTAEQQRGLEIYSYGHDVYLKDLTGNPVKGDMFIYNIVGQEIAHEQVFDISLNKYTFSLTNGYYIIRVITKDKTYNSKVYLD